MVKTSESVFGDAVLRVLADQSKGEATVQVLVREIPNYVNLTEEDCLPSETREGEDMWEQRVRNLKSHDKTPTNVIARGYVEQVVRGKYRITDDGLEKLGRQRLP